MTGAASTARTQIFLVSSVFGAAVVAAALDAGMFGAADRRLLLTSGNAAEPEAAPEPPYGALGDRFDEVLSWNDTIAPFHPAGWSPRDADVPLWERHLRRRWALGEDEVELVVPSVHADPAQALVRIFPDSPVDVHADGLAGYGPTGRKLDPLVGTRIGRLLHPGLVPGLRPLLLTEYGVEAPVVPAEALVKALAAVADAVPAPALPEGAALLLGQSLAADGVLSADEEDRLHLRMLRGAAARGHRTVVFKPHPRAAEGGRAPALEKAARELGVELATAGAALPAEVLYRRVRPALVVGCLSTALLTAFTYYGLPVARTGTELLLERLAPYEHPDRIPATITDLLLPDLDGPPEGPVGDPDELAALLRAVGYCMRPRAYPGLRDDAVAYLADRPGTRDARARRYFKRRRLTSLALPGAVPSRLAGLARNPALRRIARRVRARVT